MALLTTSVRIFWTEFGSDPLHSVLYIGFSGNHDTYFKNCVIGINLTDANDMQELDLLWQITGVTGETKWESQLVGKWVRLIVDVTKKSRTEIEVVPYAIGHKKEKDGDDNFFIVLNSKRELLTEEKAKELIINEFLPKK